MSFPPSFYQRSDVVAIARELLGMELVTQCKGVLTSGIIVETEAYAGVTDRASHAYGGRRTKRTEVMYGAAGRAYVYLCYGLHHLFNVVTSCEGEPHAVLIRAIEPLEGIEIMLHRRKKLKLTPALTAGPGAMSQALGIALHHTGLLLGDEINIRHAPVKPSFEIQTGTRVGVSYAQEHAHWPYRFWIKDNPFVSRAKGL